MTDPESQVINVGTVAVTISFEEVDYTGKKSEAQGYVAPKPLFPYEYGTLSDNVVSAGGASDSWHYAVVSANSEYAWDGSNTTGLTISNYQTYKTFLMKATVAAASEDQVAGFDGPQSSTITLTPNDTKTGLWTAAAATGDLVSAPVTGAGYNQRTLTVTSLSTSAQTIEFGYVMVYGHGAVITDDCEIGFTVSASAFAK